MPVICLEGASAVGKSTTGRLMMNKYDAFVIEEVNKLFAKKQDSSDLWYFERQVDRWSLARQKMKSHNIVILDGDPFQPLWYNWCYDFLGWQPLDVIVSYYRMKLVEGTLSFPDKYILLYTDEKKLYQCKVNDHNRKRTNFEKHLKFIKPQMRFFEFMASLTEELVVFVEAKTVEENTERIVAESKYKSEMSHSDQVRLFDLLVDWISTNKAFG